MRRFTLPVLAATVFAAFSLHAQSITDSGSLQPFAEPHGLSAEDEARIDQLLAGMTLEQRVGQMFMVTLHGEILNDQSAEFLRTRQPGAVSLFSANITSPAGVTTLTNDMQATMREVGGVPLIVAIDQEGGVVARLTADKGFTVFPAPVLMAAAGPAMSERVGTAVAEELSAVGIHMNLAPVADLETNPDNPIIFRRAFGNDPIIGGEAVAGFVRGSQAGGVMATVKHFPGHGDTSQDSHGTLQRLDLSRDRLNSTELVPFQMAMDSDVAAVMVAHIWYPALDPTERLPASLSRNVITGLLREDMGYDGIVMTDALDMNAVDLEFPFAQASVMAAQAGADVLVMGPGSGMEDTVAAAMDAVIAAVRSGTLPEARVNEAARRILRAKLQYGLLDGQPLDPATAATRVNAEAHAVVMDDLFRAGATVAYDESNLVPIPEDRSLAMIFLGTRYQIQQDCTQYRDDIAWYAIGDEPDAQQIQYARGIAEANDIAVVWTQDAIRNPAQAALVNALPQEKTVAVALWSARDWQVYPNVAAFVALYSPLRPAVPAGCAALFGATPMTARFPLNLVAESGQTLLAGGQG